MSSIFRVSGVVAIACMLLCAAMSRADTLTLKDGRTFTGNLQKNDDAGVRIDAMVSGIRATLSFRADEVESAVKGPLPPDFFSPGKAGALDPKGPGISGAGAGALVAGTSTKPSILTAPPPADPTDFHGTGYLVVPIKGVFGVDVTARGLEDALTYADHHREIHHIVFDIDSPGGLVQEADEIMKLIDQHSDHLKFHAVIKSAISASIWVVFSCDTIHMRDGATLGGAVVFSRDRTTGSAEVDAKMNSILAANLRALAEKKGHPPLVVEPMVIQAKTVASWVDDTGKVNFAYTLPPRVSPEKVIFTDDAATILTLTKEEAVRSGVAGAFNGPIDALGKTLGIADWAKYNDYGEWAMGHFGAIHKKEVDDQKSGVERIGKRMQELVATIRAGVNDAERNDPTQYRDYTLDQRGRFTAGSQAQWTRRTDAAISAWGRVRTGLMDLKDLDNQATKLKLPKPIDADAFIKERLDEVNQHIEDLRSIRNRTTP